MLRRTLPVLTAVVLVSAFPGLTAYARKKKTDESAQFHARLSKDQKIVQALNRLTFGPRPGDFERVKKMGIKKWIDLQLHPERIPENPALEAKLRPLDSLRLSQSELLLAYPSRQLVRQMVAGRIPFPSDPEKRMMIHRLAERYERRFGKDGAASPPKPPEMSQYLSDDEALVFRRGRPQEKLALFESFSPDRQDDLLDAMPYGIRMQLFVASPPALRRRIQEANGPEQVIVQDLTDGKLLRAIYSNRQLEEILTDFWFNHFNVYLDKGADRYLLTAYERDVIRPHVLGKFEDLLKATARSPAMLYYLDNWQSVDPNIDSKAKRKFHRGLNENYGRELMELHTLGVDGGYTQHDVTEVARCFTGWTIKDIQRGGEFWFNPRMHDNGEKVVLGVVVPAGGGESDGLKVLDIIAHHPSTARFISRQLAQRFVADNPPPELVARMAQTFQATDGDLREVLKTMLNSKEFWSKGAFRSKVKSPLEMVASAARALDADVDYGFPLVAQVAALGEPLYRKMEPTGYSNNSREWVNTASLLARMNFGLALAGNHIGGVRIDAARFAGEDPKQVIKRLLLADLPPGDSAAVERSVDEQGARAGMPKPLLAAALTLGSPEFQKR